MESYKLILSIGFIFLVSLILGITYFQQQKTPSPKVEQIKETSVIPTVKATDIFKYLTESLNTPNDYKELEEKVVDFRLGFVLLQKSYQDKRISQQDYQMMADKYLKYYYEYLVNTGKKSFLEQMNIHSDSDFAKSFYKNVIDFSYSESELLKNIWGNEMRLIFSPYDIDSIKKALSQYTEEEIKKAYNFSSMIDLERNLDLHIFYRATKKSDCNTIIGEIVGDKEKRFCNAYFQ